MLELEVKKLGINGEGIAYHNKKIVFIEGALPNERVEAEIIEETETYIKAKLIGFFERSSKRVEPFCMHYGECGGCSLQHLEYNETLVQKRQLVIEAISKYTKINPKSFEIKPTIGMDDPYHYRNKSSLPVKFLDKTVYGIYKPNTNHLVAISECEIQYNDINNVNNRIAELMDKHGVKPFMKNKGTVKYIVVRQSLSTSEIQVTLILGETKTDVSELAKEISQIKNVVSVYTDINKERRKEIFGNKLKKHVGKATIKENLGKYVFSLLPNAFFQLNPKQTVVLYDEIKKAAKLSRTEVVLDAYCGVGTIGIWVSSLAKEVIGIENNKESIVSAGFNAENNKIKNIKFIHGDCLEEVDNIENIDVVLVDPPRVGLQEFSKKILEIRPKRIVYTSCNPSTLAKDLEVLSEKYKIQYIQPIDMFPFTSHVETVVLITRVK